MVAILLGADNGFFYAGQIMHFSSPFTVFLIYHKQNSIVIDNGVDEQGVLYYSLWSNDGIQTCHVPVYGYYASSEKILSKLFCKLSDTVISNGDTKFQINLYAHDYEALALFSMMQFGYIYEQGRLEITDYPLR